MLPQEGTTPVIMLAPREIGSAVTVVTIESSLRDRFAEVKIKSMRWDMMGVDTKGGRRDPFHC